LSVDLIVRRYGEGLGLKVCRMACATPAPRTCSRAAPTCATSRSCSATASSTPPARYAHVAIQDLRDVIEKAHPREKRR